MRPILGHKTVCWARNGLTIVVAGMAVMALIQIGLFVRALAQAMTG